MAKFKQVALIGRHHQTPLTETLHEVADKLTEWGVDFVVEQETALESGMTHQTADINQIAKHCDLAVSVGGDGNLLRTARMLYNTDTAIVGINKGQLGYLTDISPDHLEYVHDILEGEYTLEERFLFKATVKRDGQKLESQVAFNDLVLFPGEVAQLIEFEVRVNGDFVYRQRSDGLILATPTGSTAYSLSAGGPILQPDMNAVVLTPMMPHTLTARPLVVDADSKIDIYIVPENFTEPRLSHDGQKYVNLKLEDHIQIEKAAKTIKLVHPKGYDYYSALRSKLNWSQQPVFGG